MKAAWMVTLAPGGYVPKQPFNFWVQCICMPLIIHYLHFVSTVSCQVCMRNCVHDDRAFAHQYLHAARFLQADGRTDGAILRLLSLSLSLLID